MIVKLGQVIQCAADLWNAQQAAAFLCSFLTLTSAIACLERGPCCVPRPTKALHEYAAPWR